MKTLLLAAILALNTLCYAQQPHFIDTGWRPSSELSNSWEHADPMQNYPVWVKAAENDCTEVELNLTTEYSAVLSLTNHDTVPINFLVAVTVNNMFSHHALQTDTDVSQLFCQLPTGSGGGFGDILPGQSNGIGIVVTSQWDLPLISEQVLPFESVQRRDMHKMYFNPRHSYHMLNINGQDPTSFHYSFEATNVMAHTFGWVIYHNG